MKFIIEERIPFIKGVFEPLGIEVRYLAAEKIDSDAVRDADLLVTRTRTRCDSSLLEGSSVRMIATATIGTDHIDLPWCAANGITVANAPGCNAPGVAQYVMAAILRKYPDPSGKRLGIVGVGHVGSIVARWAEGLGMRTILCDPPREEAEGSSTGISWASHADVLREAEIITYHTPLTLSGAYPTHHLLDGEALELLGRKPMIINTCRGPVTETGALLAGLESRLISSVAMDCWENEPRISLPLLERAEVATPHIAGYTKGGKIRATAMAVAEIAKFFNLPAPTLPVELPRPVPATVSAGQIISSYDIDADTARLRKSPENFEELRNTYDFRAEP